MLQRMEASGIRRAYFHEGTIFHRYIAVVVDNIIWSGICHAVVGHEQAKP